MANYNLIFCEKVTKILIINKHFRVYKHEKQRYY